MNKVCPELGDQQMITTNAQAKVRLYDKLNLHYNIVAQAVYSARGRAGSPFGDEFLRYLVAALISFDMGRMMGKGARRRYLPEEGGFAARLRSKLTELEPVLSPVATCSLAESDIREVSKNVSHAYSVLALGGPSSLNENQDDFHVGASKILHFVNPDMFLIVDSNAATAYREVHRVDFRKSTQPGYSCQRYLACLDEGQKDILAYGLGAFRALDPATPIARIYDKLAFVTGQEFKQLQENGPES